MKKKYRDENDCLNCGTLLTGNFCPNCGQENLPVEESFGPFMKHAVSDYFHFDHQIFHTLKPLLLQPGKLTNEYMAGHRAQFLHPVKMYLFISIVYFLLLFQSSSVPKVADTDSKAGTKVETGKLMPPTTTDATYRQYAAAQQKLPAGKRDGFFAKQYNKRAFFYLEKYGSLADEVFLADFKHNVPKMMFIMLPLFALILQVAFRKNKKYYVSYLIYSLHLHCFLFLFLAMIMLIQMIVPASWGLSTWLNLAAALYIVRYIYHSLRIVYQRSPLRTAIKMAGIFLSYIFVFAFCMCLVFLFTTISVPAG